MVGYGFLSQHTSRTLLEADEKKLRFRCTEIGHGQTDHDTTDHGDHGQVKEFDNSLAMLGEKNIPNPSFDVNADVMRVRADNGTWTPDLLNVRMSSDLDLLQPGLVTNVVYYLWCEEKIFEFQHYLSVLSVARMISPQRIVFYYAHYPRHDLQFYHTWFEDMKKELPYIELADLGSRSDVCSSVERQRKYITELLEKQGGIYVHFNTIFLNFPLRYRQVIVTDSLSNGIEGFLVARKGILYTNTSIADVTRLQCHPAREYSKIVVEEESTKQNPVTCIIKKGPYFPRDAWYKSDVLSKTVNMLLYDSAKRPEPLPSNTSIIPNIGHVMWLGGGEMNYLFYLNCLSQLYILKLDTLYIHGDMKLTGKYWDIIKQEKNVIFVQIVKPDLIFRNNIKVLNHMIDVYRIDTMTRYGGVYSDTDVIWIKPIPPHLREYDAVASYDWPQMYNIYPDYIQIGVLLGKPGAPFWNFFLHSFKKFKDNMYGYNGLLRPYKIFERHPDLLYVYDRLQVMCWELRCHPTWYPNFRSKDIDHRSYLDFNWREAHAFHWTYPTPDELLSEDAMRLSNTMFAKIGKHVLTSAGRQ